MYFYLCVCADEEIKAPPQLVNEAASDIDPMTSIQGSSKHTFSLESMEQILSSWKEIKTCIIDVSNYHYLLNVYD